MITHLDDGELRRFTDGTLAADDLLRADDHLAGCAECRARVAALKDAPHALRGLRDELSDPSTHLSDEEIQLLVTGPLTEARRTALDRHLSECLTCARQVNDLRSWSSVRTGPAMRPLAMAATILLAALVPAMIWYARTARSSDAAPLPGFEALAPAEQGQVRAALEAGVAPLPGFIEDLVGPREAVMGSPPPPNETFALTAPVGTGVASDRPQFEWRPLADALDYTVSVFDQQSNVVVRSPRLTGTTWTPSDPLPRARTYVWQVAARRAGDTVTSPITPAPPARFHVIDEHTADVLRQVAAEQPQSHTLLGVLNMAAGVRDEAARQFRQVQPTDPGAAVAQQSLVRLDDLARRR